MVRADTRRAALFPHRMAMNRIAEALPTQRVRDPLLHQPRDRCPVVDRIHEILWVSRDVTVGVKIKEPPALAFSSKLGKSAFALRNPVRVLAAARRQPGEKPWWRQHHKPRARVKIIEHRAQRLDRGKRQNRRTRLQRRRYEAGRNL